MEVGKREISLVYIVLEKSSKLLQKEGKKQGRSDKGEELAKGDEFRERGSDPKQVHLPGSCYHRSI